MILKQGMDKLYAYQLKLVNKHNSCFNISFEDTKEGERALLTFPGREHLNSPISTNLTVGP